MLHVISVQRDGLGGEKTEKGRDLVWRSSPIRHGRQLSTMVPNLKICLAWVSCALTLFPGEDFSGECSLDGNLS